MDLLFVSSFVETIYFSIKSVEALDTIPFSPPVLTFAFIKIGISPNDVALTAKRSRHGFLGK